MKHIIIHYGELSTKGRNRKMFQQKIAEQIRKKTEHLERIKIDVRFDFIQLTFEETPYETLIPYLKEIPGISRFEPVYPVAKDLNTITEAAIQLFKEQKLHEGDRFRIIAKRQDKSFEYDTYGIQRHVGSAISKAFPQLTVDLDEAEHSLVISISRQDQAFLSLDSYQGLQGMPYGSAGRGMLMLSGGFDSPIAGYLMMRRGMELEAVHFASPPYTSPQALEKAKQLTAQLARYGLAIKFHEVPFTEIQEAIHKHVADAASMTVMRRFMVRIMERLLDENKAHAMINGESLGQVASQTIESMAVINEVTNRPILRPLIATDKNDIIQLAKEIGTYTISNQAYEDCCTVFAPKNPHTRPRLKQVEKAEKVLDISGLVERAVQGTQVELIDEDYGQDRIKDMQTLL